MNAAFLGSRCEPRRVKQGLPRESASFTRRGGLGREGEKKIGRRILARSPPPRGVGVGCFSTNGQRPSATSPTGDRSPALAMGRARRVPRREGQRRTRRNHSGPEGTRSQGKHAHPVAETSPDLLGQWPKALLLVGSRKPEADSTGVSLLGELANLCHIWIRQNAKTTLSNASIAVYALKFCPHARIV